MVPHRCNGKTRPGKAPLIVNQAGESIGGFRTSWETAVLRAYGYTPSKDRPLRDPKTNSLTPQARKAFNAIDLHWHDGRHEYACRLAERGVPITKIQYLLGHASVVTTERYIHHTLAELSKAAAVLESGGVFDPSSDPKVGKRVARRADSASAEAPDGRIHWHLGDMRDLGARSMARMEHVRELRLFWAEDRLQESALSLAGVLPLR